MNYYIKIQDINYNETYYLAYTTRMGTPFYYLLDKKNYNKQYPSAKEIVSFKTNHLAEIFIANIPTISDQLPIFLNNRKSIQYSIITKNDL